MGLVTYPTIETVEKINVLDADSVSVKHAV